MRMTVLVVALFGATLAGCVTANSSCGEAAPLKGVLEGLPEPQQLQSALRQVVQAHCECEFSSDVREIIPNGIDGHGSWGDINASCLGPIEIVEWSRGDSSLIAIYVLQKGKYKQAFFERHLIMANFVDQRWLFSWPASLGQERDRH